MAILPIYSDAQKKDPNGNNFRPPVKPIKYAKAIATKNGTISASPKSNSSVVNTILAGR
jgi:hypothetical protein